MSDTIKACNPYMNVSEAKDWHNGNTLKIRDYTIKPKRDFGKRGFYDAATRSTITMGWVVCKGGANATPGAGWYHTRDEAMVGLNLLIVSKGDAEVFHALFSAMKGMTKVTIEKAEKALRHRTAEEKARKGYDGH